MKVLAHILVFCICPIIGNIILAMCWPSRKQVIIINNNNNNK